MAQVSFEQVTADERVKACIRQADEVLSAIGYTEHGFSHVMKVARAAGDIMTTLGFSPREAELAAIAGYLHDVGNVVNRAGHAQSGALLAYQLLTALGMDEAEKTQVVCAVGHHDEATAAPVTAIAAALIIADKSDVRRSRVRDPKDDGIHGRVNSSVDETHIVLDRGNKTLTLSMRIDTAVSSVMEYFEAFLSRMELCRAAAQKLSLSFKLEINGQQML